MNTNPERENLLSSIKIPLYKGAIGWRVFFIRLVEAISKGLAICVEDGSLDHIFDNYFGKYLRDLNLSKRRMIRISHPGLEKLMPLNEKELWFDLNRYK